MSKRHLLLGLAGFFAIVVIAISGYIYMNYYTARNYLKEAKEFQSQGDEYWASKYATNALIFDKEYADAYLFKAEMSLKWNNYELCLEQIKSAIKFSDEPSLEMEFVYGICLYKTGHSLDALPVLSKIYKKTPGRDSISYFLGEIYKNEKLDYKSALQHYKVFFENHKNSIDAGLEIGDCYYKLDQTAEAEKFYTVVLRINDENPDALYGIAKCFFKDNRLEEGCEKAKLSSKFGNTKAIALLETYCGVVVDSAAPAVARE